MSQDAPATRILNSADHPLLGRPAAASFHLICLAASEGLADALQFVRAHSEFTFRDAVDVCLADQHLRASRQRSLPAESYLEVLRERFGERASADGGEVVCHEFALRLTWSERGHAPVLDDFRIRFPQFVSMLKARFEGLKLVENFISTSHCGELGLSSGPPTIIDPRDSTAATWIDAEHEAAVEPLTNAVALDNSQSLLGNIRPFSQLPKAVVQMLEQHLQRMHFEPGQYLIRQGESGDGLFVIETGEVEVRLQDDHSQFQVLGASQAHEIIGEMALLTDERRTADVVANGPVQALFLPKQAFESIAARHPIVSRVLTLLLADRLGHSGRDALAGKVLGGYRILNRLGKGGMAIVYQAEDLATGETVALKMMSHRLVYDARALRLFENEARVIRSFDHPHIVQMLGRFEAFRSYFIVMEFCEGISLEETIRSSGPLSEDRFRQVLGQVAAALHYAHERQVVHRDVKPSNIMLSPQGVVKLMDFGLANPVDELANAKRTISGTPQFMAPEQLRGDAIDQRADIFALGCTAYRLLTGESLIKGRALSDIMQQHGNWEVPSFLDLPRDIAAFLRRCLQSSPEARVVDLQEIARWAR